MSPSDETPRSDFLRQIVEEDRQAGRWGGQVVTRFPPEPNGYLHIGHAMAISLSHDVAREHEGRFHLRFDDTNPLTESEEFVRSIQEDIRWLGFDWGEHLFFASDYFEQLYAWAERLVQDGKAYVCDLSAEEVREHRGTLTEPGRESPYRDRSVAESLDLLRRMRAGEFPDGARSLRARIDMASPNLNLRDPVMYRILHAEHYRRGTDWCLFPTYDWAHGQSDSIEGITASLCSLEFEDHRPLYDWFLDALDVHHPRQIEFARLNVSHTVTSKRALRRLVGEGFVRGWDDPRMPTLAGLRRRGYPPAAVRGFLRGVGVSKRPRVIELQRLEHSVRDDLNRSASRVMGVVDPLEVVIENFPEGETERLEAVNNPEDPEAGSREVPFTGRLFIERDDFMEDPPRKFFRLAPGREVRLRYGYFITCVGVERDERGEPIRLRCTYDPETRGGQAPDGRKVRGTIHWVSAEHALPAELRLYGPLFRESEPDTEDLQAAVDPDSLTIGHGYVEPSLALAEPGLRVQFERRGYFAVDPDSRPGALVFNRTVTLRDSWKGRS